MRVTVTVGPGAAAFAAGLAALPPKAQRAMVEGLNEGGDKTRTPVRRDLRDQTDVKAYGSIVKRTDTKRAHPGKLSYEILGTGKGMPILEFRVSAGVRRPVTATPWGVAHTFARSFKTSGQGLLRARLGPGRMPIRALYGPSVAKEIVKDRTAAHFLADAAPRVEAAVMKRLARILP
ncbi:hypothetical protein [Methylobacterium oryzihabitans]|uniref:Prophage minor tail protein Z (GPZ) n=1 Tax=Methylobacterium oryzihabitans TaxID=2499852 RepID=A0A3S2V1U3_9HYPH|nr:hypothetical protein [Methylobacterium oryzihabitans]RVU13151.1 hypothetical protein EOE48_26955 [Methylobacterium oryzihabitans]